MNKLKILYVWGYGDTPESEYIQQLKENLDSKKFTIISDYYAQYNPKEAIYDLENIIEKNKIDIIIGENLGGYLITLLNNDLPKIIINPIFDPVTELAEYTIGTKKDGKEIVMPMVPKHIINFYKENNDLQKYYNNVCGIFSVNDNFEEYSKLCKCIKSDDLIKSIADNISNIK